MIQSGGNKNRHWHHWMPMDKDIRTIKRCECGRCKRWNGKKWITYSVISSTPFYYNPTENKSFK